MTEAFKNDYLEYQDKELTKQYETAKKAGLINEDLSYDDYKKGVQDGTYKAKYDSLYKKEGNDAKFVLLSLAKPFFTLDDWQYMSYRDLCCNVLIDISFDNAYYNALLVDYRRFICKLQQISNLLFL